MGIFDFLFGGNKQPVPVPSQEPTGVAKPQVTENIEELKSRISDIITNNFPTADIRKDVSAADICALSDMSINIHPACTPVDFLALKDGKPYLAIVIVRPNTYRGMNVIGTKKICDVAGIRYERFFSNMPNEKSYIEERLKNLI